MSNVFIKAASSTIGAIALATMVVLGIPCPSHANEAADCPEPLEGIELSDRQLTQLWQLEEELDERIDAILPLSDEQEAAIEVLEANFETKVAALLSDQQKQQIERLDQWADDQLMGIVPEWFEDAEEPDDHLAPAPEEPAPEDDRLSPDQVKQLEDVEELYDQRFQRILNADQQAKIAAMEEELDDAIDSTWPEPTATQENAIELAEREFEEQVAALLTLEQRQQVEQNLACEWSAEPQ